MYNNFTGILVKRKENAIKVFKSHHNKHKNRLLKIESESDMCMSKSIFFRILPIKKKSGTNDVPNFLTLYFNISRFSSIRVSYRQRLPVMCSSGCAQGFQPGRFLCTVRQIIQQKPNKVSNQKGQSTESTVGQPA